MGSFDYTVQTTATPAAVLDYLADLRHFEEFVDEVDEVNREGEHWQVVFHRSLIPDMVVDYTVTSDSGSVVAQGTHASIDCVDSWEVAASPEGSEVRYHGTYELKGPTRLAGPLAQLTGTWRQRKVAERLGRCLDALPGATG